MGEKNEKEKGEKLVILLTTSPESEDAQTAVKLAEAALSMKKDVHIFLMCDGVYNADHFSLSDFCPKGAQVTLCSLNASERKVSPPDTMTSGSQYDLAILAHECHRFLAFN
jgi:sulfur relay (sulfurtransferase) complex TusBCD TusD component (DsrE family)